MQILTKFCRKS